MTESPGERELADALRDVVGDTAAREVARELAALRLEVETPGTDLWQMWSWQRTHDTAKARQQRVERSQRIAAVAEELADLLKDEAELPVLTPNSARNERARSAAGLLFYTVTAMERADAATLELCELSLRLRKLAQLAATRAAEPRLPVKPGPSPDLFRLYLVKRTANLLRLSGVRIGTGERSPAVLALEAVLTWYPLPGDARQLLRDLKRAKHWALASRREGTMPGGESPGAAAESRPP